MATVGSLNLDDASSLDPHLRPGYRKVGLFNGVLIGLALALGTWGLEALSLIRLPLPLAHGSLILGTLMLLLLCGLCGWLSSRMNWTWLTVILWTVAGMVASLIIGYQPSFGRSLVIWLVDWRFWGIPVYPVPEGSYWGLIVLGGLFVILVFIVLALLQGQRLDAAQRELKEKARMSRRAWWMLLAPLPLVAIAGWATGSMLLNPAASAANVVYDAIETTRDYEGDLFVLGLERGANYAAVRADTRSDD